MNKAGKILLFFFALFCYFHVFLQQLPLNIENMSDEFLTVSELGQYLKDVLRSGFPQALWVCGEVQELREKNNHLYFTLSEKDKDSNQVIAKIGITVWANARPKIDAILKKAENAFPFQDDLEVKVLG